MKSANFVSWERPRSPDQVLDLFKEYAEASACGSWSRFLLDFVRDGDYRSVVEFDVPYDTSVDDFRAAVQIQAFYKKNPWIDLGYDPKGKALEAFVMAELRCQETNRRLSSELPARDVSQVIVSARRKIARILGDVPDPDSLQPRFGPGANTSIRRAQASLSGKLSAQLACSEDMLPYVSAWLSLTPTWVMHHCTKSAVTLPLWEADPSYTRQNIELEVHHGKLVFVPKSAKTHRPIVVEPILNGFFQLGVGSFLKRRLKHCGLDLTDQENNRKLACKGSLDGSLATIDLSSASDTLAYETVSRLLPFEWVEFLGSIRTGTITYEDFSPLPLEKFSSMGNGYTFELESLIFWALSLACTEAFNGDTGNIGVFGDDIIVETEVVPLLIRSLDWLGFEVNTSKSFWAGPFRESCGADWLQGNDVRPFFIKEEVSERYLYVFHNWLMRRGETQLAKLVLSWTHEPTRLFGPDGYGDGHLLGDYHLYLPRDERRKGYGGGYFDTYALKPKRHQKRRPGDWLIPGYSIYRYATDFNSPSTDPSRVQESPSDPWVLPGTEGYVRRSIYTFSEGIFLS